MNPRPVLGKSITRVSRKDHEMGWGWTRFDSTRSFIKQHQSLSLFLENLITLPWGMTCLHLLILRSHSLLSASNELQRECGIKRLQVQQPLGIYSTRPVIKLSECFHRQFYIREMQVSYVVPSSELLVFHRLEIRPEVSCPTVQGNNTICLPECVEAASEITHWVLFSAGCIRKRFYTYFDRVDNKFSLDERPTTRSKVWMTTST